MGTSDGGIVGTTKIVDNGPANARWNMVLLSDGYKNGELAKFATDAQNFVTTLFATAPFDTLKTAINVYRVDVFSTDSGADDPTSCTGGTGAAPKTYFDAAFCNNGVRRLLVVNNGTAINVANAQVPQHNMIMVLVNSTVYGGSGGSIAVFSMAPSAVEIGLHEMGHTAFGLADEYEYYAGCGSGETGHDSYAGAEPTQTNITINTNRTTNKWKSFILAGTAMPTTHNADCTKCDPQASPVPAGTVGTFEGGGYFHCKIFRPEFNCRMRALGFAFCAVCRDRIIKTLAPYKPQTNVTGNPSLVQSRFGTKGNFELVAAQAGGGGMSHYWRNNDAGGYPWNGPFAFSTSAGTVDAVSLIQSNYGSPGNLEVVARIGNKLAHFWRDSGPAFHWNGPFIFGAATAAGNPSLVQSRFGTKGNFELVVPLTTGGMAHYWRNNDAGGYPWNGPYPFGTSAGTVSAVSLIQSNYGSPGNLEVVARIGNKLAHFWRDSGPAFHWNGPFIFGAATAAGNPSLVQSRFGTKGNFELVVPLTTGGMAHYWRNNDAGGYPWNGPYPFGTSAGTIAGVSLIQSNYGSPGNLEVVARIGNKLSHFWRDSGPAFKWNGPFALP